MGAEAALFPPAHESPGKNAEGIQPKGAGFPPGIAESFGYTDLYSHSRVIDYNGSNCVHGRFKPVWMKTRNGRLFVDPLSAGGFNGHSSIRPPGKDGATDLRI